MAQFGRSRIIPKTVSGPTIFVTSAINFFRITRRSRLLVPRDRAVEIEPRLNPVRKRKQGTCIYCGETGPITRDHVPPECIFPDPKPVDLITVPACDPCNESFKLDDEYFRTFLITGAPHDATARGLWNRKIIGSRNAEPIRRMLRKASRPVDLKTQSGIWVGKSAAVSFDAKRVARVAARIVLGLWWNHHRTRPGAGSRSKLAK